MNEPAVLIEFDHETWAPTAIFPNGRTDQETAKLREIADRMVEAVKEGRGDAEPH